MKNKYTELLFYLDINEGESPFNELADFLYGGGDALSAGQSTLRHIEVLNALKLLTVNRTETGATVRLTEWGRKAALMAAELLSDKAVKSWRRTETAAELG